MRIAELDTGEAVHCYKKSIVVPFNGKRRVLSTAALNGGYREDLTAVFNHDCTVGAGMACTLKAPTYKEHMALTAEELGLDSSSSAGLATAAQMENVSIRREEWKSLAVTAIVTGGIEVNGGRAGDPTSWYEPEGTSCQKNPGTINIMVFFNTDLSEEALVQALITCTEAKAAAIQELLAPSRYSMGIATGSGTDGVILAADRESPICLTDGGKHSKLGELLGKAVKEGVKEALDLQTGLNPHAQCQVIKRMERFGITNDRLWEYYPGEKSRAGFEESLEELTAEVRLVTYTSLYAHLLDQLIWGLISPSEAEKGGSALRSLMGMEAETPEEEYEFSVKEYPQLPAGWKGEPTVLHGMIDAFGAGLERLLNSYE